MRVRITKRPPRDYSGAETGPLLVGRVYNLAPAVASALMLEGYAELYETLTPAEKRERSEQASQLGWTADDRVPGWPIPSRRPRR